MAEAGLSYKLRGQPIPTTWKGGVDSLNLNSVNPYLVFNNNYYYSNFVHGVDDWHRTPVDSGISAFTLLKYFNLGVNDRLGKYIWFASSDYQAFPEVGGLNINYQFDKYEVGQDINNVTKYTDGALGRREVRCLINSTVALYDSITYFYETNFLLTPFLPPISPTSTPTPFFCLSCPVSVPAKSSGNADCDSKINVLDFSSWLKVYENITHGLPVSDQEKGEVDFTCQPNQGTFIVGPEDAAVWARNYSL